MTAEAAEWSRGYRIGDGLGMRPAPFSWFCRQRTARRRARSLARIFRCAAAAALVVFLCLLRGPVWADPPAAAPGDALGTPSADAPAGALGNAPAAPSAGTPSDAYSATVNLDATAKNAVAARHKARLEGERRALEAVVEGLGTSSATNIVSALNDPAIEAMVVSYSVADEHMSSTRYQARYTYHFDPAAVGRLMESAGLTVAPAPTGIVASGRAVVLPIYRDGESLVLWSDPNAWRQAWSQLSLPAGPVGLLVPLGGIGDLAAIDAQKAIAGDPDALTAIAQQNGAAVTIVALATAERSQAGELGLDVLLKRYREGTLSGSLEASFTAQPGESPAQFMMRVAQASIQPIENGFETGSGAAEGPSTPSAAPNGPSGFGTSSSLVAVAPLNGLRDWVALRRELAALPSVRDVELLSLSREEAKITIRFVGTEADLQKSLAADGLTLAGGDPLWRLEPADPSRGNRLKETGEP